MTAPNALYTYDPDALTVTCRACRISEYSVPPGQAGPWHAGHRRQCGGTPGGNRPPATVLRFPGTARPARTDQGTQA